MTAEILSSVIGAIAVFLLGVIARSVHSATREFRRFMQEHLWLLATSLWTRDKVILIMKQLSMPIDNPPPDDLPKGTP